MPFPVSGAAFTIVCEASAHPVGSMRPLSMSWLEGKNALDGEVSAETQVTAEHVHLRTRFELDTEFHASGAFVMSWTPHRGAMKSHGVPEFVLRMRGTLGNQREAFEMIEAVYSLLSPQGYRRYEHDMTTAPGNGACIYEVRYRP